jgi:molybdopterin molybdotransferase
LPYEKALALVLGAVRPLPCETLASDRALGRFLARPARARAHAPRFEQSAMDGFAVRMDDVAGAAPRKPVRLELAGEMPAGGKRKLTLEPGRTVKVFTGSPLPAGTQAVVMKEHVSLDGNTAAVAWRVTAGDHIRRVGEEYRRGQVILPAGVRITPPVVGMLVTLGIDSVPVPGLPAVTVITMGDELVPPGSRPGPGRIPDSNGPAVAAALRGLGITRIRRRRVKDSLRALTRALENGLDESDVVITVGGASVGDHDHAHAARRALKLRERFSRVAIKPGKPNLFGLAPGGQPVFGLPGNPVSALVSFQMLVRPALLAMMGAKDPAGLMVPVRLRQATGGVPERLTWTRAAVRMEGGVLVAEPLAGQGSHMLSCLALADALIEVPAGEVTARAGEDLTARLLDWC